MITNVVPAALARAILVARQCQSKSNRRGWNTPFEIGNDTHHHKAQTRVIILEGEDAENNYFMIKNPSNQPLAQRSGVTIEACLAVHNDWWVVKTIWKEEITSFLSNSRWNDTWAMGIYIFCSTSSMIVEHFSWFFWPGYIREQVLPFLFISLACTDAL